MEIQFDFKNFQPSEHLKEYARTRFEKLNKYIRREDSANLAVLLEVDRYRQIADVKLTADDLVLTAQDESEDMYATIDQVMDKLKSQLKKSKDKQKDRRKGKISRSGEPGPEVPPVSSPSGEAESEGGIVREEMGDMKPMTPEEALIQLQQGEDRFLVFLNAEYDRVNVLYSKNNGDYGLIDPRV